MSNNYVPLPTDQKEKEATIALAQARPLQAITTAEHAGDITSHLVSLESVVLPSRVNVREPNELGSLIMKDFNSDVTSSAFTETVMPGRGKRFESDEFMIAHRDNKAELIMCNRNKIALAVTGLGTIVEELGTYKIGAPFYGGKGKFVINVPRGRLARGWSANKPLLLGEGTHIIHDNTFRYVDQVDQSQPFVEHGSLFILRVPAGQVARRTCIAASALISQDVSAISR
jgi:hypothetical protein